MLSDKVVSTPGRISLFGEHLDCLNLPLIQTAISRRLNLIGNRTSTDLININLLDTRKKIVFSILKEKSHSLPEENYFSKTFFYLKKMGYTFSSGFDCQIRGKIPMHAGAASFAALLISWIEFLTKMSDQKIELTDDQLASIALQIEHSEFEKKSSIADFQTITSGGVNYYSFTPKFSCKKLSPDLEFFVLGNPELNIDRYNEIMKMKNQFIFISETLKSEDENFSILELSENNIANYEQYLNDEQIMILRGIVKNNILTNTAFDVLSKDKIDQKYFGELLNKQHAILRDNFNLSNQKIEDMIKAALDTGAFGAKVNTTGGGISMIAYAPEYPEHVFMALRKLSEAYVIHADVGITEINAAEWI